MALPSQEKIFEDVFYKYETTCMEYETICPKECGELNRDCIEKCGAINACFAWQTGNVSEASFFGGTEADIYKNKCSQYSASDYTKYVITPDTPKKQEDAKVGMSMHGFLNYSNSESFWKCSVKKFTAKLRNIFSPNRFNDYKTEVTTGIPPIIKMPISPEKINIRTDSILKNETLKEKNR
jgi:hypothetical protein